MNEGSEKSDIALMEESEERDDRPPRKSTILVVLILSISAIISTTSLMLSIYNFAYASSYGSSTKVAGLGDSRMCMPCKDLQVRPREFDLQHNIEYSRENAHDGTELCCPTNDSGLKKMIDLYVEKKIRESSIRGCLSNATGVNAVGCKSDRWRNFTIASHVVYATPSDVREANPTPKPITGWNSERAPSFLEKVELREDRLVVPASGLYYVYSQVSMIEYHDSLAPSDSDNSLIQHLVQRWNIYYPEVDTLLRHSETKTRDFSVSYTEYVSYVGGVIFLRAGDELFVSVTEANLVQADGTQTYFGLYRV